MDPRVWLKGGFFHLLGGNALGQVLAFLSLFLAAFFLTDSQIGDARLIQSITTLVLTLGIAGASTATLKLVAEARPDSERLQILRHAAQRVLLGSTLLTILTVTIALTGHLTAQPSLGPILALGLLAIPFLAINNLLTEFLNANGLLKTSAGMTLAYRVRMVALSTLGAATANLGGYVAGTVLAAAATTLAFRKSPGFAWIHTAPRKEPAFAHLARFGLLSNGVWLAGQYGDMILLDRLVANRAQIGSYAMASLFLVVATQVNGAIQTYLMSRLGARSSEPAWVRAEALRQQLRYLPIAAVVAVAVLGLAWLVLNGLYPNRYVGATEVTAILMVRYLLVAAGTILLVGVLTVGRIELNVLAAGLGTVTGLSASALLIPSLGIQGAAWGQVLGAAVMLVAQVAAFTRATRSN